MPHPRPPRLQKHVTRHGNVVWYVRSEHHGPRVRLRAAYGSPEFEAEYLLLAAIGGKSMDGSRCKAQNGSLAWLWDQYRQTGAWTNKLKPSTRRLHENVMRPVLAAAGKEPFTSINRKSVVAGRERRSATPAQARKFLDAMRGLFRWALESGHVKVDPTAGVKNPQKPKNNGFPIWTEEDVEAYHRRWPLGTRQRVWLDVLLYTGLRRGDVVRIGRQHVRDGVATLRTEKGGETIEVTLPVLEVLQRTLDAGPTGDLAWICGEGGRPFVKEAFGNAFSEAARAAGVRKSAHGVRKIAATTAANNGATVAELEAIFGWQGGRMAALYTKAADRQTNSVGFIAPAKISTRSPATHLNALSARIAQNLLDAALQLISHPNSEASIEEKRNDLIEDIANARLAKQLEEHEAQPRFKGTRNPIRERRLRYHASLGKSVTSWAGAKTCEVPELGHPTSGAQLRGWSRTTPTSSLMMITSFFVLDIDRRLEGLVGRCAQEGLSFLSHCSRSSISSPVDGFGICGRACSLRLKTSTSGRGTNIVENSCLGLSTGKRHARLDPRVVGRGNLRRRAFCRGRSEHHPARSVGI